MEYWIFLSIALLVFVSSVIYIVWKEKIKYEYMERTDFVITIVIAFISLLCTIVLSIDLPSVLSGGQEIYVNELPTSYRVTNYFSYTVTDNEELRHLKGVNWNKYEKNGNYRIRYTKFTKLVLDVEKLD